MDNSILITGSMVLEERFLSGPSTMILKLMTSMKRTHTLKKENLKMIN